MQETLGGFEYALKKLGSYTYSLFFASLHINCVPVSNMYGDKHNLWPSVIVGVGSFSGGTLTCTCEACMLKETDICSRLVTFAGDSIMGVRHSRAVGSTIQGVPQAELDAL